MPVAKSANQTPRIILGSTAIIAGLLLTLRNLGVPGIDDLLDFWPVVLVAVGLAMAFRPRGVPGRWIGIAVALLGAWILLRRLGVVHGDLWDLWPLFLVFAGGSLVWRATRGRGAAMAGTDPGAHLSACSCLGGAVQRSTSQSFRGADLTAVLGRCEVDLAGAAIGGGEAIIDLFAWCGAIEIRVPPTWTVTNEVRPILGAVVDKRESGQADAKQQLVVRGMAIMGGVEIRH